MGAMGAHRCSIRTRRSVRRARRATGCARARGRPRTSTAAIPTTNMIASACGGVGDARRGHGGHSASQRETDARHGSRERLDERHRAGLELGGRALLDRGDEGDPLHPVADAADDGQCARDGQRRRDAHAEVGHADRGGRAHGQPEHAALAERAKIALPAIAPMPHEAIRAPSPAAVVPSSWRA